MARALTAGIGSQSAMTAGVATISTWWAATALLALAATRALPSAQRASPAPRPPDPLPHDLIFTEKP